MYRDKSKEFGWISLEKIKKKPLELELFYQLNVSNNKGNLKEKFLTEIKFFYFKMATVLRLPYFLNPPFQVFLSSLAYPGYFRQKKIGNPFIVFKSIQ